MPRKRYSTEQIVTKLRQAEVELGRGLHLPGLQEAGYQRVNVLPLAGGWWIAVITDAASSTRVTR